MKIDDLLSRLKKVRRSAAGWSACCPVHDDRSPSLSIKLGDAGRILVHCHVGCTADAVVAALGLSIADLFDGEPGARGTKRSNDPVFTTMRQAVDAQAATLKSWKLARAFEYTLASGAAVLCSMRFENASGDKTFRLASMNGTGWILRDLPGLRPLYNLTAVGVAKRVSVFEGEKCVEQGRELGLDATTSAGGANGAVRSDWTPLAGKDVYLFPDNDAAGRTYSDQVADILSKLAPPARVRVVHLSGLAEHGDIVDFVASARASGESDASIRARIELIADATELLTPPPSANIEFEAFPIEVFPLGLRDYISFYCRADCVDPSFVALPLLSTLAGSIGNAAEIELKPGWTQPPLLWTCTIGKSGSRKSVALRRVLSALHRLQRAARKEHDVEMREFRRLDAEFRKQEKAAKQEPTVVLGDPPERPSLRRYLVTDTTAEALASILANQAHGLVVGRDELSGLIRSFNQYKTRGGSDEAFWLALFDAESVYIERKTGDERSIAVERPSVSITGGVQPGILADVFTRAQQENGLLSRILFTMPPDIAPHWNEEAPPELMDENFMSVFERLSSLPLECWPDGGAKPHRFTLGEGAHDQFVAFYEEHGRATMDLDDGGSASYSKLLGICGRLALILELTRWAGDEEPGLYPRHISRWAMDGAIRLSRWFAREALRVQVLLSQPEQNDTDRFEAKVRSRGGTVSVRDVERMGRGRTGTRAFATSRLQALVDDGRGVWLDAERSKFRLTSAPVGTSDVGSVERPKPLDPEVIAERDAIQAVEREEEVGVNHREQEGGSGGSDT